MFKIIDNKKVAAKIKHEIAEEVKKLREAGKKIPHLAAILVRKDGSSETYVANKVKDCSNWFPFFCESRNGAGRSNSYRCRGRDNKDKFT